METPCDWVHYFCVRFEKGCDLSNDIEMSRSFVSYHECTSFRPKWEAFHFVFDRLNLNRDLPLIRGVKL